MVKDLFANDHKFNNELIDQRGMFVAQHSDLIVQADYDLSARELKIMDFLISRIKPEDENLILYTPVFSKYLKCSI